MQQERALESRLRGNDGRCSEMHESNQADTHFNLQQRPLRRLQLKPQLHQARIVKMPAPDKRRWLPSPLPHRAGTGYAHGPEQQAFAALGAGHDAAGPERAACGATQGT